MTSTTVETPKVEKPANPRAWDDSELPTNPPGTAWDVVEIGKIDFALLVAEDMGGVSILTKGNEAKAAQLFNRALRIDAPQRLDARERITTARKNGTLAEVVRKLQEELYSFDVTTIATRAPRTPPTVTAEDKDNYSKAEVAAMLAQAKVKFVTR